MQLFNLYEYNELCTLDYERGKVMPDEITKLRGLTDNNLENNITSKTNIVINLVNITDVIDSHNSEVTASCVAIIGIEPFVLENLTIEGVKRNLKITKDHEGNIYINKMKARFYDIGDGIKILVILSEEKNSK